MSDVEDNKDDTPSLPLLEPSKLDEYDQRHNESHVTYELRMRNLKERDDRRAEAINRELRLKEEEESRREEIARESAYIDTATMSADKVAEEGKAKDMWEKSPGRLVNYVRYARAMHRLTGRIGISVEKCLDFSSWKKYHQHRLNKVTIQRLLLLLIPLLLSIISLADLTTRDIFDDIQRWVSITTFVVTSMSMASTIVMWELNRRDLDNVFGTLAYQAEAIVVTQNAIEAMTSIQNLFKAVTTS
jgi:hypothetical protein